MIEALIYGESPISMTEKDFKPHHIKALKKESHFCCDIIASNQAVFTHGTGTTDKSL
jgi:hypothetical protein